MYTLNWQPPYDWQWMFGFFAARAVTGVETVTEYYYERSFGYAGHQGIFRVVPDSATHTLAVSLSHWPDPGGGYLHGPHCPPVRS